MTPLPVIFGRQCVRAPERAGFVVRRRERSHIVLRRTDPFAQTTVPDHRTLDRGTLRAILRQASIGIDEFVRLLDA